MVGTQVGRQNVSRLAYINYRDKGSIEGSFKCQAHEFRVYLLGTGEPMKASEQNGLINTVCGDKYIVHL